MSKYYFLNSFFWGSFTKIIDAAIKFLTIPLLLLHFGKEDYGLLTLAIATNSYMQLLDLGMNVGGVKFFSQWIHSKEFSLIDRVARTNLSFYFFIGLINSIILILISFYAGEIFNISPSQLPDLKVLFYILSFFSVFNWITFVFQQLLIASENIAFSQRILLFKSLLSLIVVFLTLYLDWSLKFYFFAISFSAILVIFPYYRKCRKYNLIRSFIPALYVSEFKLVFKYGLGILMMGVFQFTASQSRPLVLGAFYNGGVSILSDYRIIEVFPIFIISIGGMLTNILLPRTSKAVSGNNMFEIEKIAYNGTKFTSIVVSILCFPVIINSEKLLFLYVGSEFVYLNSWLSIWVLSLTLFLYNSPIASLVLATGKTKMLVLSSFVACSLSIIINIYFVNILAVGSAVIGYVIYIIVQMSFYYFYFNSIVLKLSSYRVFVSFFIPTSLASVLACFIYFLNFSVFNMYILDILFNTLLWFLLYVFFLFLLKVLNYSSFKELLVKKLHR